MVRKIEVIVPTDKEKHILEVLKVHPAVHHLLTLRGIKKTLFTFKIVNKKTDDMIEMLTRYGVGNTFGSISMSAINANRPRITTLRSGKSKKKQYNTTDRRSYDEIYDMIDSNLHLTFDYMALIVVAAMISAVGILTDSSVTVVASMLVSPLMGPILGMTFGTVAKDWEMVRKSIRNEMVGVSLCLVVGLVYGCLVAVPFNPRSELLAFGRNTQMSSRGDPAGLIWGACIAIPSGLGVALGITGDVSSALIGTAISAALLPPIVNCGIATGMGIIYGVTNHEARILRVYFRTGGISLLLFFLNWALIFIFGFVTFHQKKINDSARMERKRDNYRRFNDGIYNPPTMQPTVSKTNSSLKSPGTGFNGSSSWLNGTTSHSSNSSKASTGVVSEPRKRTLTTTTAKPSGKTRRKKSSLVSTVTDSPVSTPTDRTVLIPKTRQKAQSTIATLVTGTPRSADFVSDEKRKHKKSAEARRQAATQIDFLKDQELDVSPDAFGDLVTEAMEEAESLDAPSSVGFSSGSRRAETERLTVSPRVSIDVVTDQNERKESTADAVGGDGDAEEVEQDTDEPGETTPLKTTANATEKSTPV